jgi:hypothetical protein
MGKAGVFCILAKGRLASDAQFYNTLSDALFHVTAGDSVQLDPGAVAILKQSLAS